MLTSKQAFEITTLNVFSTEGCGILKLTIFLQTGRSLLKPCLILIPLTS